MRASLSSLFGQSVGVRRRFGGNICITVCLCALEGPLKPQRCWGWVDLSVEWGFCDVAV